MAKAKTATAKLEVKAIAFKRRINTGDFNAEEYSIDAQIEGDVINGFAQLKGAVESASEAEAIPWPSAGVTKENSADKPKAGKKKTSAKKSKVEDEDEEETDEEEVDEEESEEADDSEDETEDADDEEESDDESEDEDSEEDSDDEDEKPSSPKGKKTAKKAPAKEATGGKKKVRKKGSVYSRGSDLHKKLFMETLREVAPTTAKTLGKPKKVSIKLDGIDFLDGDGNVLETFKAEMKKAAKSLK